LRILRRDRLIFLPLLLAFAASGCSRAPAGSGFGPRLAVTLRFGAAVDPTYYYYVVIRNSPDTETIPQNWPIPTVTATYGGNGFAADATPGGQAAFTDFVLFGGGGQPTASGYALYHLNNYLHGDITNPANFRFNHEPDIAIRPSSPDDKTLYFELALDRLRADPGECATTAPGDCPTAKNLVINIIVTNKRAVDPNSIDPQKYVDAIGDQSNRSSGTFNKVVTIDTSHVGSIYQSSTDAGDPFYEPDGDAIDGHFSSPGNVDKAMELVAWQMQIKQ
jgi:hypothetical protein